MNKPLITPALLVWGMIVGLLKYDKDEDFEINMDSFGNTKFKNGEIICAGCAAIAAIQVITKKEFDTSSIITTLDRSNHLKIDKDLLNSIENFVDALRKGFINKGVANLELIKYTYSISEQYRDTEFEKVYDNIFKLLLQALYLPHLEVIEYPFTENVVDIFTPYLHLMAILKSSEKEAFEDAGLDYGKYWENWDYELAERMMNEHGL